MSTLAAVAAHHRARAGDSAESSRYFEATRAKRTPEQDEHFALLAACEATEGALAGAEAGRRAAENEAALWRGRYDGAVLGADLRRLALAEPIVARGHCVCHGPTSLDGTCVLCGGRRP